MEWAGRGPRRAIYRRRAPLPWVGRVRRSLAEQDGLGYRGVVVRGLPGACAEVRLGEGSAHARCADGDRVLADAGHTGERAALATGRGRIDAGTLALIREAAGLDP